MTFERLAQLYENAARNGYTERAKSLQRVMLMDYPEEFAASFPEQAASMRQGG